MNSKQQVESAAIVLDCLEHGESDVIVTFFCRHIGRLTGIAKGAKRSKKRFVNKLEIFSSLQILHTVPQSNRLAFIAEADLWDGFLALRNDLSCYTTASVIREFVLLATKEMEGDDGLYPLLLWSLNCLNSGRHPTIVLILFLIRFYAIIGYSPMMDSCLACGKQVRASEAYCFHVATGGLRCSQCCEKGTSRLKVSQGTLKSLTAALHQPLERLNRLQFSKNSQAESLALLHSYGRQLFQREIISWAFLVT